MCRDIISSQFFILDVCRCTFETIVIIHFLKCLQLFSWDCLLSLFWLVDLLRNHRKLEGASTDLFSPAFTKSLVWRREGITHESLLISFSQ